MTATSDPRADRADDDVSLPTEPEVVKRPAVTAELVVRSATVAASARCSVSRTVRPGSGGGPDHRCVERRLAELGYAVQGPNQVFDSRTMASLRRFARDRRVTWRGVVTPLLLVRLRIWAGPEIWGRCDTASTIGVGVTRLGARCLEMRLAQLGYDVTGPNRYFDAVSARSLRTYQAAHALYVDGIAGSVDLVAARHLEAPPVTVVRSAAASPRSVTGRSPSRSTTGRRPTPRRCSTSSVGTTCRRRSSSRVVGRRQRPR